MAVQFFDITEQNKKEAKEIDAAIEAVVLSGRYILGETVANFENVFAKYCGTKLAVGVASGTDALHLALRAAGVKEGDEVITTPFTFVATAEAIVYCGAKPVFVDIEPKTFNIDPTKIEAAITDKTKAILPVHLYGLAAAMPQINKIAQKHNLVVVEDCAQATGAEINGQKVGSTGTAGGFSFFPTKNLGCFGDGGIITTNDEKMVQELKVLRNHGSRKTYHHNIIGYNSRLDALQAAILNVKLKNIYQHLKNRRQNADVYRKHLAEVAEIKLPFVPDNYQHTYNQFTLRAQNRDALQQHLKDKGIAAMVYYPISLHLQEAFAELKHKAGDFPESEKAQEQVLSLPIFPELSEKSIVEVCSAIKEFQSK